MAALSSFTPTRLGVASSGNPVAASDTIAVALLGTRGAYLEIINGGGSPDAMTISDAGTTPAGTPAGTYPASVTNGTSKEFFIAPSQADPVTGLVTITHGFITSVTYKLRPLDRP